MIHPKHSGKVEVREQMRGGAGKAVLEQLAPGGLPPKGRLFSMITLAPGCSIGEHVHEGETELFHFLSGEGKVLDDGQCCGVTAGDSMSTGSGHSHAVENTGDTDLVFLAVIILD